MSDRKDPWTILGISRQATIEEIKTQYKKLALTLHPDKHTADLTLEQRKEREDHFKEVTVAYHVAMDMAKARENGCDFTGYEDYEKWKGMWERVEQMIRDQSLMTVLGNVVKGTFKDMAKVAIERMSQAQSSNSFPSSYSNPCSTWDHDSGSDHDSDISSNVDTSSYDSAKSDHSNHSDNENDTTTSNIPHIFHVSVTLDEIHTRSSRRVRLFLKDYPKEPFFIDIDFTQFPEMIHQHIVHKKKHTIILKMEPKRHPVYYWDSSLGGWDLYTTMPISLYEYFKGSAKMLPKLGKSTTEEQLSLEIPAFADLKKPIVFEKVGLRERGNLYVMLEIRLPTKNTWEKIEKKDPNIFEEFLNVCKKLENLNASHRASS